MEIITEGPLTSHPSVLDGKNFLYWKPRMIFFIKTLDERAWRALVAGYKPLMITVDDLNVLKLINSYSTAKEAWRILEVAYEETSKVKISRLKLIISNFEALKMFEDESVSEYNERVLEIANESLLLGEKIPDSKIVRKLITSNFEALKMSEGELISEYSERVLEIANESLLLGEKIPDSKSVWNVLQSLPRKFDMKV
ncbi:gag-pol polyprotein [Cucumis melo var. makuwa]|uniref:Gag-pol polyprotein n=1 Tax=Cucumis melo var. makuwa TaxID=1194695 RepID=A0A5A7TBN9_CUCMM|nr:gag-pol polyprotein [Cucumis melo var. makuwa]